MTDKRGRDQFVIRYGDETEVFWNDAARTQAGLLIWRRCVLRRAVMSHNVTLQHNVTVQ